MNKEYAIFHIEGGKGKNIASTGVIKCIKKKYPEKELIVVSPYPEVFINNPNIYRVFQTTHTPYFYEDYIKGKNTKIFAFDPYNSEDFILQKKNLIHCWCDMYNLPYENDFPELFFSYREQQIALNRFISKKPIMVIQTHGGTVNQAYPISWSRDLPLNIARDVVNHFCKDYEILHIKREDQLAIENATPITLEDSRLLFLLIALSEKRLFIDSFAQHAAAALRKPSTVCWVSNNYNVFGYPIHHNITPEIGTNFVHHPTSYLYSCDWTGSNASECNYTLENLYNPENIIKSLETQP